MRGHLKNLFIPHEGNNHKPRILQLSFLAFFVFIILAFQTSITLFHRAKPGVLGFATNIQADLIVSLTNDYRLKQGLDPLSSNPYLEQAARAKAEDMFANGYWAHYSPTGTTPWSFFKTVGYEYVYAGENLARDFNGSSEVVAAWMASSSHKDNILSGKYKEIGVAVVNGTLAGEQTTLVVQLFGSRPGAIAGVVPSPEAKPAINQQAAAKIRGTWETQLPLVSSWDLTKTINLSILFLLLAVLAIDAYWVWKAKIIRLSGRSVLHLSFFIFILLIVILAGNGKIL